MDAYNETSLNLNQKKTTSSLFLDLSKVFDSINHTILLNKLEKFGIRGLALKLFESYLMNRLQYTIVNNASSGTNRITYGIPQGSTLGPLLFIIYVNDMPSSTNLNVKLFAHNTNLTISHHKKEHLEKIANNDLNKPSINYNKTEYVIITNKKEKLVCTLKIDENITKQSSCVKCLGVLINSSLTWKPQIHKVCSKIASGCWALYHLRKYVDHKTLLMVYHSILHSHLSYCMSTLGGASISAMALLHRL